MPTAMGLATPIFLFFFLMGLATPTSVDKWQVAGGKRIQSRARVGGLRPFQTRPRPMRAAQEQMPHRGPRAGLADRCGAGASAGPLASGHVPEAFRPHRSCSFWGLPREPGSDKTDPTFCLRARPNLKEQLSSYDAS